MDSPEAVEHVCAPLSAVESAALRAMFPAVLRKIYVGCTYLWCTPEPGGKLIRVEREHLRTLRTASFSARPTPFTPSRRPPMDARRIVLRNSLLRAGVARLDAEFVSLKHPRAKLLSASPDSALLFDESHSFMFRPFIFSEVHADDAAHWEYVTVLASTGLLPGVAAGMPMPIFPDDDLAVSRQTSGVIATHRRAPKAAREPRTFAALFREMKRHKVPFPLFRRRAIAILRRYENSGAATGVTASHPRRGGAPSPSPAGGPLRC